MNLYSLRKSFLIKLILFGIFFIGSFTVWPFLILVFIPVRLCVLLSARIFRPDLKKGMDTIGAMMGLEDYTVKPRLNMCSFFVLDGHIEIEKMRALFQERVIEKTKRNGKDLMYPELRQFWTTYCKYTFWKDEEDFDLKKHVRLYSEPQDDNVIYGEGAKVKEFKLPDLEEGFCEEDDLRRLLGHLLEKPWPVGRSPWEMLLIQNYKPSAPISDLVPNPNQACTVVIFRIHHAMADGYSCMKLLSRDLMAVPPKIKTVYPKVKWWKKLGLYLIFPFKLHWDASCQVLQAVDFNSSWHGWGRKYKLSRKIWISLSKPIDMELIKKVKNKFGVGYNAVLCSSAAAACQRLMEEAGQKAPQEMSWVIPLPWPGHPDGLINHITIYNFKLPIGTGMSPEMRLRTIAPRMSPSKYETAPLGFRIMCKIFKLAPNPILKVWWLSAFTGIFSSFPGSQDQPTFNGLGVKLIDTFVGIGPGFGTAGIALCFVSANGKQRLAFNIDKRNFPDDSIFQKAGEYVEEEILNLLQLQKDNIF